MKNLLKTCLTAVLVLSMLLTCGVTGLAGNYGDGEIRVSPVRFTADENGKISASAFVRNQGEAKSATLICAVYSGGKLENAESSSGSNAILTTTAIDATDKILKAFVWDSNLKVISNIATYDSTDVFANLKLTVDGVDFADYVDEETVNLSVNSAYTKTLDANNPQLPTDFEIVGNNGLTLYATTDESLASPVTTIKVGYGMTTSTSVTGRFTTGNTNETTISTNTIPEKTYTITYKAEGISLDSIADNGTETPVVAFGTYSHIYKKTYEAPAGDAKATAVTVDLNKEHGRGALIVVQPKDGRAEGNVDVKLLIVKDINGTAYTAWNTDITTENNYDYVYDETTGKYTQKQTTPLYIKGMNSIKINGTTSATYGVVNNFKSQNGLLNGSRPAIGATPASGNRRCIEDTALTDGVTTDFTGAFAPLSGGQYIPLIDQAKTVDTVDFFVDRAVDVYVIDTNAVGTAISTLTTEDGWTHTEVENSTVQISYQNPGQAIVRKADNSGNARVTTAFSIARAIKLGKLTEADIAAVEPNNEWRFISHDIARKVTVANYTRFTDYPGTPTTPIEDYKLFSGYTTGNIISNVVEKGEIPGHKIVKFDITPGVTDGGCSWMPSYNKFSIYTDRTNGMGVLMNYNPALDIKGAETLKFPVALFNGTPTDWSSNVKEYYNFTLSCDAEVMVFANSASEWYYGATVKNAQLDTGWTDIELGYMDLIAQAGSKESLTHLSVKEYKKGDTVKIYSPGFSVKYIVVVKPID